MHYDKPHEACGSSQRLGSTTEDAAGQDARLNALLEQYGALLHRTILRVCPRELGLLCDDIEQEALLSLWKALQSGREIAFPVSYIYKVAVRQPFGP